MQILAYNLIQNQNGQDTYFELAYDQTSKKWSW
jgi:hypothetical protein